MRTLKLVLIVGAIAISILGFATQPVLASPTPATLAALPGLGQAFRGKVPQDLGVRDGQLSPCPDTPNCVATRNADPSHAIAPIPYHGDRDVALETLLKVLAAVPRTTIIERQPDYVRVEFSSRLMGFVDDGEFYLPADRKVIQMRSAARLGESDLGVNRRRLEQIRLALQDLEV
jgi:uncharacterized protein (DUF1499 family)